VADLKGAYKLNEISFALQNIINQYYAIPGYSFTPLTAQQNWTLNATIFPSPLLEAFAPQLKGTDTL